MTIEGRIRARLQRVEALHQRATTDGERVAAANARERLLGALHRARDNDPIARFCAEHVAALGVAPDPPLPPERLPQASTLLAMLARWESGDIHRGRLRTWAERLVDRVVLPADPAHEGAVVAEVLLQLAALEHVTLRRADVPAIRRFVRRGDWDAWFALVARAAARS